MRTQHIIKATGLMALMLAAAACQDDHFDIHPDVAARGTVWEQIQSDPELTEFADLLQSVCYSKSESNTTAQTYADFLNHDQTFTVWAPVNGTFGYGSWKALASDGTRADIYKVETQLIRNCLSRYSRLIAGGDSVSVAMFNDKNVWLDCAGSSIQGIDVTASNIEASNGVLHKTNGPIPYLPNLYEFLKQTEGIDSLRTFVTSYEEDVFDENQSTQGPTIDGNITWVDSVSQLTNSYLLNDLNARLNSEDSTYVMIMPTDNAWAKAYQSIKPYYKYMSEYVQSITTTGSTGNDSTARVTTLFSAQELDSITHFRIDNSIARVLAFNMSDQEGHSVSEMTTPGACDSVLTTSGFPIYDPQSAQLFDGQSPQTASNGYAFIVDNYNYRPEDTWLLPTNYEAEYAYENYDRCTPVITRINRSYTYLADSNDLSSWRDTTITETVLKLTPERSTANCEVTLQIPNTYSCKYNIYAVMAYNQEADRTYQFRAYINYHNNSRFSSRVQLAPPDGSGRYFHSRAPHVDQEGNFQFNDSVLLASEFELPVCYYGLQNAHVTIELSSYITSSQRSLYTNELLIDKIVMVPIPETEE